MLRISLATARADRSRRVLDRVSSRHQGLCGAPGLTGGLTRTAGVVGSALDPGGQ
jgi:hypothetical protein